jgi:hypothetical protein
LFFSSYISNADKTWVRNKPTEISLEQSTPHSLSIKGDFAIKSAFYQVLFPSSYRNPCFFHNPGAQKKAGRLSQSPCGMQTPGAGGLEFTARAGKEHADETRAVTSSSIT